MSAVATLAHVRAVAEKDGTFNLKHAFAQFDVDGDGSISHEELSTILLSLIPDLAYDEILSVINLFDPNNDGDISYVEFAHTFYTSEDYDHEAKAKQSMVKIRRMAASKKGFSLRSAFQRFDVDGDGSVSHDELKVVINDILQGDITENEMQDVIKLFDPDNDGEINYKEFRDLFYSISIETEKTRSICEHTNENIDDAYVETHIIPGLMRDEYCALKLSHNNIGDEGAVEISNAISDDKSQCSIVDLRNNKITAESSEAIGKALGTNVYVHTLLLSHNTLTGEGAANICASLAPTNAGFSAISTLDLRHCDIDDNGGGRLGLSLVGNTALKNVSLCGNRLGRKAGESIAKALGNTRCIIESINLANNTIDSVGARALAFSLKANRECKEFIISGNVGVGDSGVSAFAEVLEGVEEGDTVRCGLRVLGLAGCGVGDGGIVELMGGLRSNEVLATLDLRCNSFGDDGGVAIGRSLEENTAIRELYLGSNELRTAAATAMGSALEKNVSLLVLDLSNTDLSGKNAGLLADGLHKNEALLELNVSRSEISDNGMSNFLLAIEQNQVLDKLIYHCNPLTASTIAAVDFALSRERKPAAEILDNMEAKRVKRRKEMKEREVARNMTMDEEDGTEGGGGEKKKKEQKASEMLEAGVTIFVPVSFGRRNNIVGKLSVDSTTTLSAARIEIDKIGDLGDDYVFISVNDGRPIDKAEEPKRQVIWDAGRHIVLRPNNWIEL